MEHFYILMFLFVLPLGSIASSIFDVTKYGALGNGEIDDSQAFLEAWKATCEQAEAAKLLIPGGKTYLLSPTSFHGPCQSHQIILEIRGELIAPLEKSAWKGNFTTWLSFKNIKQLVVKGNGKGRINGRGYIWWKDAKGDTGRPSALQFSNCENLLVNGLNHVDSPRNHISLVKSNGATITNLNITAPGNSPNTDGIDISFSKNIRIHNLNISTGDDCIAINGGCSNLNITNVACGPGHGISIGSLGRDGLHDEVENIHVQDCSFNHTQNGVRIKTWQGGSGFARNITFTGIKLHAARNPIIIDQYYCPHSKCNSEESNVEVSNILYSNIQGTSIRPDAIIFSCSQTVPCSKLLLENITITSFSGSSLTNAHCLNAYGIAHSVIPNITCLMEKSIENPEFPSENQLIMRRIVKNSNTLY